MRVNLSICARPAANRTRPAGHKKTVLGPEASSLLDLTTPGGWKAELTYVTCYIPRWFTCPKY